MLERSDRGETAIAIAKSLEVGKTQIQTIISDKDAIRERWEKGGNAERKYAKQRKCPYGDLNERIWKWFCDARRQKIPVSGRMIQEKGVMESVALWHHEFTASNGWLYKWMKRYDINSSVLCGDRAEVSDETVEDWIKRVPNICEGYSLDNIFNADETGLYFRAMPSKSMIVKGDDAGGIKTSKERFTVLLCASASGVKVDTMCHW